MDEYTEERFISELYRKKQAHERNCLNKLPPEQAVMLRLLISLTGFSLMMWLQTTWHDNRKEYKEIKNCFRALHRTRSYFLNKWELIELFEYFQNPNKND